MRSHAEPFVVDSRLLRKGPLGKWQHHRFSIEGSTVRAALWDSHRSLDTGYEFVAEDQALACELANDTSLDGPLSDVIGTLYDTLSLELTRAIVGRLDVAAFVLVGDSIVAHGASWRCTRTKEYWKEKGQ